jgi:signal transduction histidine kinase/CheY-like chemotaxis protein
MLDKFEHFGLLTSGFTFDESESELLFRFRILNYFLLIGALFSGIIGFLGEIGVMKIGSIQPRADFVYAVINLYLLLKLRQSKKLFSIIAWLEVSSLFILVLVALVTVQTDEFRMVWFYIVAYFSYLLLNIFAGIFFTSLSIISILSANHFMNLHLSDTAIYTAAFGLIVIGILSWASVSQLNEYERLQLIQNRKLKKNVKELDDALSEAKEASKIKNMFLANMSHEIRTPMNGMLTFVQAMRTTNMDQTQLSYLRSIEQSGNLLKTLIDDLLDLSSIEAGKVKINPKVVKVQDILDNVLLQVDPLFQGDGTKLISPHGNEVKFTYGLDDSVPKYIVADGTRLAQVIVNLINNARKFTEQGEIKLNINGQMKDDESFNLLIEVNDTGAGIPSDKVEAIFETFHQLSEDRVHNSGAGLGLSISKNIIEAMNGSIRLHSVVGKGSQFVIDTVFPVAKYESHQSPPQNVSTSKFTVLLVEDDKISRFAVKTLLEHQGHDVIIAENGKQAIDMLKQRTVDVILMDVYMPELNGIEATEIIKSERLSQAPIIGMTASVMLYERDNYFKAGMDALLEKPISFGQLVETINQQIAGS